MRVIYTPLHKLYKPKHELDEGVKVIHGDVPERVETILDRLQHRYFIFKARQKDDSAILRVHSQDYVNFLKQLSNKEDEFSPAFCRDDTKNMMNPYSRGTSKAVFGGVSTALSGVNMILSGQDCFCLTRPPGHHAGYNYSQGVCYLNNAVIAARDLIEEGYSVAILDFDLHHGNGTQELIRGTPIKYVSIHEDPNEEMSYIHKSGHTFENSKNNLNLPLLDGTKTEEYLKYFTQALDFCYGADVLLLSAGFDISPRDKHSRLLLDQSVFSDMGRLVSRSNQKKLILLEGGYYNPLLMAEDVADFIEPIAKISFDSDPLDISIIYHSKTGNTKRMAQLIKKGCDFVENIESKMMDIDNLDARFVRESNTLIMGSPTYYGGVSWRMKKFLDTFEQKGISLEGKLGAAFSSANWMGGGSELTLQNIHESMFCYGMLIYSGGVSLGLPYNHFGVVSKRRPKNYDEKKVFKFGKDIALKSLELFKRK